MRYSYAATYMEHDSDYVLRILSILYRFIDISYEQWMDSVTAKLPFYRT